MKKQNHKWTLASPKPAKGRKIEYKYLKGFVNELPEWTDRQSLARKYLLDEWQIDLSKLTSQGFKVRTISYN